MNSGSVVGFSGISTVLECANFHCEISSVTYFKLLLRICNIERSQHECGPGSWHCRLKEPWTEPHRQAALTCGEALEGGGQS